MSEPKLKFICPECRCDNVTRDGVLRWYFDTQAWEMSSELDNMDCQECGFDGDFGDFACEVASDAAAA